MLTTQQILSLMNLKENTTFDEVLKIAWPQGIISKATDLINTNQRMTFWHTSTHSTVNIKHTWLMTGDKRQRKLNKNLHPELQSRKETKTSIKDPCANLCHLFHSQVFLHKIYIYCITRQKKNDLTNWISVLLVRLTQYWYLKWILKSLATFGVNNYETNSPITNFVISKHKSTESQRNWFRIENELFHSMDEMKVD